MVKIRCFLAIVVIFIFENAKAQEIKIEAYLDSTNSDHYINNVQFKIFNNSSSDIWFYVHGLVNKVIIKDHNGNYIQPFLRVEPKPTGLPQFIFIKAMESQEIVYPLYHIPTMFKFKKDNEYYIFFEYVNTTKKKKTKDKTFIGEVILDPLKF